MHLLRTSFLLASLLATSACLEADDQPDGVTSSALSFGTGYAVGGPGNWVYGIPGATGDNQTCFLTGIRGSLRSYTAPSGHPYRPASAGVYLENNQWVIRTVAGAGPGIAAEVACVATASRIAISTSGASAPFAPNRHCFLSSISANGYGWSTYTNLNQPNYVRVFPTNGVWTLQQGLTSNGDFTSSGGASGWCLDIPTTYADSWEADGGTGPNGRVDGEMEDNSHGGWMCGATKIAGAFDGGYNDPNFAAKFYGTSTQWRATAGPRM